MDIHHTGATILSPAQRRRLHMELGKHDPRVVQLVRLVAEFHGMDPAEVRKITLSFELLGIDETTLKQVPDP